MNKAICIEIMFIKSNLQADLIQVFTMGGKAKHFFNRLIMDSLGIKIGQATEKYATTMKAWGSIANILALFTRENGS